MKLKQSILLLILSLATSFSQVVTVYNQSAGVIAVKIYRNGVAYWTPAGSQSISPYTTYTSPSDGTLIGHLITVRINGGANSFLSPSQGLTSGGHFTYFGTTTPDTNCLYQFPIQNNFPQAVSYIAFSPTKGVGATLTLGPGKSGVLEFTRPCGETDWGVIFNPYGGEPNEELDLQPQITPVNYNPTNQAPVMVDIPTEVEYVPPANPTNFPIKFSNTNDTQEGFSGLYDLIAKFSSQNDANLKRISSNSTTVNITNNNNFTGETGIVSAVEAFRIQNSNHMERLLATNYSISGIGTNASDATNAANLAGLAVSGKFDDAIAGIGDTPANPFGSGSSSVFTIEFMGTSMNLDPEARLPGAMGMLKAIITFIALIAFGTNVGALFFKVSQTFASVETGGVPAINAGINIGGIITAAAVAAALIAIWVAVFVFLFAQVWDEIMMLASASGSISMTNAGALYLINAVFPVSLLISLAWTRMLLFFFAGKVVFLASAASKYLFGK